ncbi:TatD family hydrolase [soil metagenome]
MLIDTHCHIHDPVAFPDPEATLDAALAVGVDHVIVAGTHPEDWHRAVRFAEKHDNVHAIAGWHPTSSLPYAGDLAELRDVLCHPKVLAMGEIGLDFHWDNVPPDQQRRALVDQLDLAQELNMPVVFHARKAYAELLDILEERPRLPYLFHFFAGNIEEAKRAIALDSYFGIDGPITYKNSEDLRSVVKQLPLNRIVLETDSPYLAPVPMRGKPNQPAFTRYVAEFLVGVLDLPESEIASITTQNAVRFFSHSKAFRPVKLGPAGE